MFKGVSETFRGDLSSSSKERLMTLTARANIKEIVGHQTVGRKLQCRTELKHLINYTTLSTFPSLHVIIKTNTHIVFISTVFS